MLGEKNLDLNKQLSVFKKIGDYEINNISWLFLFLHVGTYLSFRNTAS